MIFLYLSIVALGIGAAEAGDEVIQVKTAAEYYLADLPD